ncbi:hypothetical protein QTG54_004228 [Skeletonema marinoi]|uniref:Uncharacterized protein n=1 Tax=Skeletonema marinoi TaxID=267567 RepID=A0AAD8YGC4_9STRA|nr:hypothetical protein QTG54_004228 [Skeletonema marinoi]
MFGRFAKSAKSVMEESFLMITDKYPNVLKQKGVKGKHTNAATQRAIQMALNLVALIQEKRRNYLINRLLIV